jgi:hypothetical protein
MADWAPAMIRILVKILLGVVLCVPAVAHADPIGIAIVLTEILGPTVAAFVIDYGIYALTVSLVVYGSVQARKKAAAARRAYNANLSERATTALQAEPSWRIVYGRAIVGGDIVAVLTSDKLGTRENGTTYTKPDGYKHLVIHVASHEVQAINDVLIGGVRVGTLNSNGWVKNTALGTGKNYTVSAGYQIGQTSIAVVGGTGTILTGDEISFPGDSTRYPVVTGVSGAGTVVIASPGLSSPIASGAEVIIGNEFATAKNVNFGVRIMPSSSVTVSNPVTSIVSAGYQVGSNLDGTWVDVTPTLSGGNTIITNPDATNPIFVSYLTDNVTSAVKVRYHLGTDTQTVDTDLTAACPTEWDSNHRLRGLAYVVVTLDLEDPRFQGGPPELAFDVSGRKVFDPRTSTTVYSTNAALCIRDYLTAVWGFGVTSGDIDDTACIAAANACDVSTNYTQLDAFGATVTTTGPLYTCNGSFIVQDGNKEPVLTDLCDSMAGYVSYGAQWRIVAGVWTTSVMDLTDADLDGQIEVVQAGAGMDTLFNGVRGSYIPAGKSSPIDFEPYQNATFLAADGQALWDDVVFPYTDSKARCRRLARTLTESNRDGLTIKYPAKLNAWPLQVGDRIRVTSAEYGFSLKYFRLTDWQFLLNGAVMLVLQEDGSGSYDDADATSADPAPNTNLSNPHTVKALTGLAATSGDATIQIQPDGTVVPQVLVSWDACTDPYVAGGQGRTKLSWKSANSTVWTPVDLAGDDTSFLIKGVYVGGRINIMAYFENALGLTGVSQTISHVVVGKTAAPSAVTGLAGTVFGSSVQWEWDVPVDADYGFTEVRSADSNWGSTSVQPLFRGVASLWAESITVAGSYTRYARHLDTTGNSSATSASATLVVTPDDLNTPGMFSSTIAWDFTNSLNGWTVVNATSTLNPTTVTLAASASDPEFKSPTGLTINGAVYDRVRARIRRLAGSGWDGYCYYTTSGHTTYTGSYYRKVLPDPTTVTGEWVIVEWDMTALTAGGTDWVSSTITGIRLDFGNVSADSFEVDWVAVGRLGPVQLGELGYTGDLNATYGATWDTNISGIPYSTIYSNDDATALGYNPAFSDWTSTYPLGWSAAAGSAPTKETTIKRTGLYSVKYTPSGTNTYMARSVTWAATPMAAGTFVSGTIDIYLGAVTSGLPGILVRLFVDSGLSTFVDTKVQPPSSATGNWQRVPFTARVGAAQQVYGIQVYIMGSWASFASGQFTGTVYFDNLAFAFFDNSIDNKTISITTTGGVSTLNGAGGGTVTITGLGYSGDLNATNGANWQTNVTNIPYSTIYSNDDATAMGYNPVFADWTGTMPAGWNSSGGVPPTKETSITRVGPYSVKWVMTGTDAYMDRLVSWATTPMAVGAFVAGTIDIYLGARTSGLPGLLVRLFTSSAIDLAHCVETYVQPGTATGLWQRVPFTARVGAGQQIYGVQVYVMGCYSAFPSGAFTGTVYFDSLTFAFFDNSIDNKSVTITAGGVLGGAGGGTVTITGLGYSGDLNATNGAPAGTYVGSTAATTVESNAAAGAAANTTLTGAQIVIPGPYGFNSVTTTYPVECTGGVRFKTTGQVAGRHDGLAATTTYDDIRPWYKNGTPGTYYIKFVTVSNTGGCTLSYPSGWNVLTSDRTVTLTTNAGTTQVGDAVVSYQISTTASEVGIVSDGTVHVQSEKS